jgi:hypothetical protein
LQPSAQERHNRVAKEEFANGIRGYGNPLRNERLARCRTTILPHMTVAEALGIARMHRVVALTSFGEDAAALLCQIDQSVASETLAPDNDKAPCNGVIRA